MANLIRQKLIWTHTVDLWWYAMGAGAWLQAVAVVRYCSQNPIVDHESKGNYSGEVTLFQV